MTSVQHFQLSGVRCNGCVSKLRSAVTALDPRATLDIELPHQHARVESNLSTEQLRELFATRGYEPVLLEPQRLLIRTEGVRCNGCLGKIQRAAAALDPTIQLQADFPQQRLEALTCLPAEHLCELIRELDYGAEPIIPRQFQFAVQGVRCNGCVGKIRTALQVQDAELQLDADLAQQRLSVTTILSEADVASELQQLGYLFDPSAEPAEPAIPGADVVVHPAVQEQNPSAQGVAPPLTTAPDPDSNPAALHLSLSGMTCAGCVATVEKALNSVPGVTSALVNFANRTALVEGAVAVDALLQAVDAAGYGATVQEDAEQAEQQRLAQEETELRQRWRNTAAALALGVPMMLYGLFYGMALDSGSARLGWGLVGLLTLAMMVYAGGHFYRVAWKLLRQGSANMDTLIALGTGAAWLYSMVAVLLPELIPTAARGLYFEAAAMIIGLVNMGQALELRARGRTQAAVRSLLDLSPKTARRVQDGQEQEVPVAQLRVGDLIRIRPGEQIAVDAEVVEGHSQVDESMLTGEPLAVRKGVGDRLAAGTLNRNGSLLARAVRVGRDTALARIIELVRKAQNSKPPISRLADRVAAVFVPVVVVIALATALIWYLVGPEPRLTYMLVTAVTVLIIACPCALGLATPISIMIGIGKAAERGILIRSGDALQQASNLTTLVLDKTGTVTEGRPRVIRFETGWGNDSNTAQTLSQQRLLALLHALELRSEHPLAEAVVRYAEEQLQSAPAVLSVEDFANRSGQGIVASVEGVRVCVGNRRLMDAQGINLDAITLPVADWQAAAETVVYVALDGVCRALLSIVDPIRSDAKAAIARLHGEGLQVVMLSGDNQATAQAVARQLGIDQVFAELQPADKLAQIQSLQAQGERVGMVGDGINDAPALSQAEVGFAIGTGTDVAIESADVALMQASLHGVADAIALSRATLSNIRQNLWGAFIYNGLGIPVAAGLLYPLTGLLLNPVIAGLAMSLSSVTVVSNANRLRMFRFAEHPRAE